MEDLITRDFANALWKCMEEQTIDDISVREILHHAKRGRSSFYRRFNDKYDLCWTALEIAALPSDLLNPESPLSADSMHLFLNAAADERVRFANGFTSIDPSAPYARLIALLERKALTRFDSAQSTLTHGIAACCCAIFSHEMARSFLLWLRNELDASTEELSECFEDLLVQLDFLLSSKSVR